MLPGNDNNAPPQRRQRIPWADLVAEIKRAGGWAEDLDRFHANHAQGWDLVIHSPFSGGQTVTLPSNASDTPQTETPWGSATFSSNLVEQSLNEADITPSPDFAAKWNFAPQPAADPVTFADLRTALVQAGYQHQERPATDGSGRVTVYVIATDGSGVKFTFTSAEANADAEQTTYDPKSVKEFFLAMNIEPDVAWARDHQGAVPYQSRKQFEPSPAVDPVPTPPDSMRDQIQRDMEERRVNDAQDVLDRAAQQEEGQRVQDEEQRRQQEQDEIRREADQRRAEQAELDRQQAERQREQPGERGGIR